LLDALWERNPFLDIPGVDEEQAAKSGFLSVFCLCQLLTPGIEDILLLPTRRFETKESEKLGRLVRVNRFLTLLFYLVPLTDVVDWIHPPV